MTFNELFNTIELTEDQSELANFFSLFSYVLDLPKNTFDIIKDDFTKSFLQKLEPESIKELLNSPEGIDVSKEELAEAINIFVNLIYQAIEKHREKLDAERVEFLETLLFSMSTAIDNVPSRKEIRVGIELIRENAKYPSYAHEADAGADVYAVQEDIIMPGETKIIPTGFKVQVPDGYELQARPRSGMSAKTKIRLSNAPGTIDCGYDGEVGVILDNIGNTPYEIKTGDRVCQLLIKPCPKIIWEDIKVKENRKGGFGSTGK